MYEWKSKIFMTICQIEQKIAHSIPHTGIKQLPQHQADNFIESFHRLFVQRVAYVGYARCRTREELMMIMTMMAQCTHIVFFFCLFFKWYLANWLYMHISL